MWSGQWKHRCTSDSLGECIENLVLRRRGSMDRSRAAQKKSPGASILFPKQLQVQRFFSQATSGASILFPCIDFIPQGASIFVSTDYLQLRRFCFGNIPRCCAIFENFKQRQFHRFCLIVMIIPATLASTYLTHRFTYLECKDIYPLVI